MSFLSLQGASSVEFGGFGPEKSTPWGRSDARSGRETHSGGRVVGGFFFFFKIDIILS